MITKKEVQIVLDLLDEKRENLINGNTVEIHSVDIENKGLYTIDQQIQVLDFLQNDKKFIKYSFKKDYESIEDVPPETIGDMREVAMMTTQSYEQIIEQLLDFRTYSIEVLKTFSPSGIDDKYKLTYLMHRLELNGILIAKPDSFSENDEFLTYLFNNGGNSKIIKEDELLKHIGVNKLTKSFHQILAGLNIKGDFRKMFFPSVSKKGVEFINPITNSYFIENNLQELNLDEFNLPKNK